MTMTAQPACIARIHRGKAHKQRIVVSAEASFDVNKSPLSYTWVVLRGDPSVVDDDFGGRRRGRSVVGSHGRASSIRVSGTA